MQKSLKPLTSILALALALSIACTSALAFPGGQPSTASPTSSAAAPNGTVVETMSSGGYTYLLIENGGQKKWAAIPNAEVKVGQQVELAPGMTMNNFSSKTLGRTFEAIVFSQGLVSVK